MRKKRTKYKKYSPEFKISCIIDMRKNDLSYAETARKYWGASTNVTREQNKAKYVEER